MSLTIYNTETRKKVPFQPREEGKVGMYVCGVTVYDFSHIGHARAAIVFDVIFRYLKHKGYEVTYVRNITDIDDKIIRRANENGESITDLTDRFTRIMHEDSAALGILPPDQEPRATDSMQAIIDMIQALVDKGRGILAADESFGTIEKRFKQIGIESTEENRQAYREMLHISDRQAILHAHQIMSTPVTTAQLTQDTLSAWEQLRQQHCHQLPVLDDRQRIVGMVSEHDLLRVMLIEDAELSFLRGKTVADIMSPEVITADPVTDVRRIARVMCVYGLSAVPIVDERDALIGLVSRTDILNSVANEPPLSLWS
mgnify:CR=1 FL=1